MESNKKISIATSRTFELIGKIAAKAAELEFVLAFCAKLAALDNEYDVEEVLSSRRKLIESSRNALCELKSSGKLTDLEDVNSFIKSVQDTLELRDSVVHGLLMHKEKNDLKMYQFRGKKWIDIDNDSLEEILNEIQKCSDSILELRDSIWLELYPNGLLQLGPNIENDFGKGTRLS